MSAVVHSAAMDQLLAEASGHLSRGDAISAERCFREVTRAAEARLEGWNGLAAALGMQRRHDDAWRAAERALALDVDPCARDAAYVNAGVALRALERYEDALALYREWLPRRPRPEAHCDYAYTLLAQGRFGEAWPSFEQRWLLKPLFGMQGRPGAPPWQGQPLAGRTVLVRGEQGLGDTIQFMRYATDLRERGATVHALVQPGLEEVIATVPGVDRVLRSGAEAPYDFYVNALSLPRALGVSPPFDSDPGPYVVADAGRREQWRKRLSAGRLKIGVAWAGSPLHARDRERSIPFASFRQILQGRDAQFVSLQKGAAAAQSAAALLECGVHAFDAELDTLADTAALVAELDLVISVDTAVAHLAGAIGIPVWLLVARPADWRWGISGTATPWYSRMRLFRQDAAGDWVPPLRRVADMLKSGDERRGEVISAARPMPAFGSRGVVPADAVADTPVGLMAFPTAGTVGRSMQAYGEYLQHEVEVLSAITPADGSVVMLGVAAHTHPMMMARGLAASGALACAELSPLDYQLLRGNLDRYELPSVTLAIRQGGAPAAVLDSLAGTRLDVVYIDGESGLDITAVLEATCLWALRPRLFVRGVADAEAQGIADALKSIGTRVWLVRTPYHRQDNYYHNPVDVFGGAHAIAFVAVPEEMPTPDAMRGWPEF